MANVRHRVSKRGLVSWQVQLRIDGQPTGRTFTSKRGADEFARLVDLIGGRAADEVLKAREVSDTSTPTLREWMGRYLDPESGLLTGITPGTRDGYRLAAERSFLRVLGDLPVDAITKQDVGRWVAWQERQTATHGGKDSGRPVAPKTVRNYHGILSSALAAAVESKLIVENAARGTRMTVGRRPEIVFLTPEEFWTLLHFIPDRHQAFVLFLAGTGCRWGEATAVTWRDLSLNAPVPTVRIDKAYKKGERSRAVLGAPKSFKSSRTISLSPDVVAALSALEPGTPDQLVFPGRSGKNQMGNSFRANVWGPALRKASDPELCAKAWMVRDGIAYQGVAPLTKRPTIHGLRHSHASWLIAQGRPLFEIAQRLGHENTDQINKTYGHLMPDAYSTSAEAVQVAMAGSRPLRAVAQ